VVTVPPTPVPTKEIIVVVVNKTANVTATPTATPTPVPTLTITFNKDMTIVPGTTVYVKAGTKVIWANMDDLKPHGIVSTSFQTPASADFIPYGKTIEVTFDKVGAYDYLTNYQPETSGKIIVTA